MVYRRTATSVVQRAKCRDRSRPRDRRSPPNPAENAGARSSNGVLGDATYTSISALDFAAAGARIRVLRSQSGMVRAGSSRAFASGVLRFSFRRIQKCRKASKLIRIDKVDAGGAKFSPNSLILRSRPKTNDAARCMRLFDNLAEPGSLVLRNLA